MVTCPADNFLENWCILREQLYPPAQQRSVTFPKALRASHLDLFFSRLVLFPICCPAMRCQLTVHEKARRDACLLNKAVLFIVMTPQRKTRRLRNHPTSKFCSLVEAFFFFYLLYTLMPATYLWEKRSSCDWSDPQFDHRSTWVNESETREAHLL